MPPAWLPLQHKLLIKTIQLQQLCHVLLSAIHLLLQADGACQLGTLADAVGCEQPVMLHTQFAACSFEVQLQPLLVGLQWLLLVEYLTTYALQSSVQMLCSSQSLH
jgi:hypothetical protein